MILGDKVVVNVIVRKKGAYKPGKMRDGIEVFPSNKKGTYRKR